MSETTEHAVSRAIERMHADLGEPLTIDDLARTAMYSKFHFTRVFERATGVSPGRFLSAVRLGEAKRLLRETGLSVTEISHRVGWSSVGSFSSRFSASVGVSPSSYRRSSAVMTVPATGRLLPHRSGVSTSVRGRVRLPDGEAPGCVIVGLFRERIPQGRPEACTVLRAGGDYELSPAPVGSWHVLACGLPLDGEEDVVVDGGDQLLVGASALVAIRRDTTTINVDVDLHPMGSHDPPVLVSFAHLRSAPAPTAIAPTEARPARRIPAPRPRPRVRRPISVGHRPTAAAELGNRSVAVLSAATMATPLAIRS